MKTFKCHDCKQVKPIPTDGITTGYGVFGKSKFKVCFDCCAKRDIQSMRKYGDIVLYDTGDYLTNWPGTLTLHIYYSHVGKHNIAGTRRDVYFNFDGYSWHGVRYGDMTQITHCKRTKEFTGKDTYYSNNK